MTETDKTAIAAAWEKIGYDNAAANKPRPGNALLKMAVWCAEAYDAGRARLAADDAAADASIAGVMEVLK